MIVLTMPICIFESQLRFANASQTTDRRGLRQGHLPFALQYAGKPGQEITLFCEKDVPLLWNIPERWQGAEFGVAGVSQQREKEIDRHRGDLNLKRSILYKPGDFFADEVLDLRNREPAIFGWWLLKGAQETIGKHSML